MQTNPEGSDLYVIRSGSPATLVGKTPVSLDSATVPGLFGDNLQLEIRRKGFETTSVLVPQSNVSSSGRLYVALKEIPPAAACTKQDESLAEVASGVAEVQLLISKKELDEAQAKLKVLIARYSSVPTLHVLMGNVHYLKRELSKALVYYRNASERDGGSVGTQRMIDKIVGIQGGRVDQRLPASENRSDEFPTEGENTDSGEEN